MFIKLTKYEGGEKYYNTEYIRSFYKKERYNEKYTVLELQYGTDLVKERPEEIMEMIKECD